MSATEIFDGLNRFSDFVHAKGEINRLEHKLIGLKNECGGCNNWMHKSLCKREDSGRFVTCSDRICADFDMKDWVKDMIVKTEHEIVILKEKIA